MESSQYSLIQSEVQKMKGMMFKNNIDPYYFLNPSAYDTAWLAMIPQEDHDQSNQPMFKNCLEWVLNNQNHVGFWGECDANGKPTIECLPATLACMVALKKWHVGSSLIEKGLEFVYANAEMFLKDMNDRQCPRWFAIVFPGIVEFAQTNGLENLFPETVRENVSYIFRCQWEELVGKNHCPPLLSYLEALPPSYDIDEEVIINNLSDDGSLFQSPSATSQAFMATGNQECLAYLMSLAQRCPNGVPPTYPMDEDILKLCMVNQVIRLGLAEQFFNEIEEILGHVYRNYLEQETWVRPTNLVALAAQLYKDSLAFRLLRLHGYNILPMSFCWFLCEEEIREEIEMNYEYFSNILLNIYRASDLMFSGEYVLEEAKSFSRNLLEKFIFLRDGDQTSPILSKFHKVIEHELNIPWLARLDHLEHRMWIEETEANALWRGKTSFVRISHLYNNELLQLAKLNYEFRQSIYRKELEELKGWSKDWGLSDMGFGREKTTYCYFAIAASTSLPCDSYIRMLVAKSAILITVADDFYDMKGSLSELEDLTDAVRRWDSRGLSSHSKIIFDALDNLVTETATKYLKHEGTDITSSLQDLWYETFLSWLIESKWSRMEIRPSIDDYIKTGMTSIATHTMVLPASCFLKPNLPNEKLRPKQYETVTKLLMVIARLLNDMQSYQKEKEEGKVNSVLAFLIENPEAEIEDSIAYVTEILDKKKKELLEHVLMDGFTDLPKPSKDLHLSCLKVFQMFFNSTNRFDSNTEVLHDIKKAIYIPLEVGTLQPLQDLPLHFAEPKKKNAKTLASFKWFIKQNSRTSFTAHQVSRPRLGKGYGIIPTAPKLALGLL